MTHALSRRVLIPEVLGRGRQANPFAELLRALLAPPQIEQPQFLTLTDAAHHTGLSMPFLRRLIQGGKLPAIRDRCIKVRRSDLDNLPSLAELSRYGQTLAAATRDLRGTLAARRSL